MERLWGWGVGPKGERKTIEAETQNRTQERGDAGWGCTEHPVEKNKESYTRNPHKAIS